MVVLHSGETIQGYVFAPPDIPLEDGYSVKLFPMDVPMESSLDPYTLFRPIVSQWFKEAPTQFQLQELTREKYTLYVVGKGFAAVGTSADLSSGETQVTLFIAQPSVQFRGRVLWADTQEPVVEALVRRSWYPWELEIYDLSLSMERFEATTNSQGEFEFDYVTPGTYDVAISYTDALPGGKRDTVYKRTRLTLLWSSFQSFILSSFLRLLALCFTFWLGDY